MHGLVLSQEPFLFAASFSQDQLQNCAKEIKESMKEDPIYCKKLIATHAEVTNGQHKNKQYICIANNIIQLDMAFRNKLSPCKSTRNPILYLSLCILRLIWWK